MQMRGDATETSIRSPLGVAVNRGGAEKHQPSQLRDDEPHDSDVNRAEIGHK